MSHAKRLQALVTTVPVYDTSPGLAELATTVAQDKAYYGNRPHRCELSTCPCIRSKRAPRPHRRRRSLNMAKKAIKAKLSPETMELRKNVTYFVSLIVACRVAQAVATAVMQQAA